MPDQSLLPIYSPSTAVYPSGYVPEKLDNNGAATALTATLFGQAGLFTYIQGFTWGGLGATAASFLTNSITGLLGGGFVWYANIPAGVTTIVGPNTITFATPLKSSAVNTSIVVNMQSFGAGNTNAWVYAWGYNAL